MNKIIATYKEFLADKSNIRLTFIAVGLLGLSLILNFYAGNYASMIQSNYVTDIVLSNIRVFDVDALFVYSTGIALLLLLFYCIKNPFHMPYIFKSVALFVTVRCAFIVLTHIGSFPTSAPIDQTMTFATVMSHLSFTGDLFFSGHTGLPFLMALIFWKNRPLRYFCIAASLFFGTVVLMGHMHYSIDVLGAFFITYGIYHITPLLFTKAKRQFDMSFKYR